MNQYTMIEKALSEHKRLSTITGAQVLTIKIVIHNDMEYDGSVCIGARWNRSFGIAGQSVN